MKLGRFEREEDLGGLKVEAKLSSNYHPNTVYVMKENTSQLTHGIKMLSKVEEENNHSGPLLL